jgi:hypothetical protein
MQFRQRPAYQKNNSSSFRAREEMAKAGRMLFLLCILFGPEDEGNMFL